MQIYINSIIIIIYITFTGNYFHKYVLTFLRNLSNASFKLNIRRRSRIFAARRCAIEATRRLVFFIVAFVAVKPPPRGDNLCDTKPVICAVLGQTIFSIHMLYYK